MSRKRSLGGEARNVRGTAALITLLAFHALPLLHILPLLSYIPSTPSPVLRGGDGGSETGDESQNNAGLKESSSECGKQGNGMGSLLIAAESSHRGIICGEESEDCPRRSGIAPILATKGK